MKDEYIISLKGTQTVNNNDETTEIVTSATYSEKDGVKYIKYKEYNPDTGKMYASTTLKIESNEKLTVIKNNTSGICNQLPLEYNVRHHCLYSMPFGSLNVGIYTEAISCNIDENGGTIIIDYSIDFNSDVQSDNHMEVILRKKGEKENV